MTSHIHDRLADARLYLCTDARRELGDLDEFVARAVAGGVDIVQLRDKGSAGEREFGALEAAEELAVLARLREITHAAGALLSVNDRADLARLSGADVLHVGQGDLTPAQAREIVGEDVVIGQSTHDEVQAVAAAADRDVDYFCVGPCWPTPTKPGRTAPGLDLVRQVAAGDPAKPWFAIGGIDARRLPEVTDAGASRIVVVRAITAADDPEAAARALVAGIPAGTGTPGGTGIRAEGITAGR
ncbi:thiamine phosphate synthase [Gordonia pseudamarae]|jgi:thiamine-phosphate pyrophosphorylase|uniref:Thiamine-phosphate synthase n=1 Tax=Gordonia pseudamarae TaxID=2831662 RepID=A0ABX6IDC6_9ACTN|nr:MULTISPECIES: thiamine phosphate synthase [Gordonia]MBD0022120.1 thiamine phosphate synthase [Gordonia sp. (in: high G+C Gram-positive bacteria)]QHN24969.1 thiamine phosphate synthase [Gordonia pseudamarae]QHN33903.1 thiamine phosphate synthase [Gordonia pseudamarae]